MERHSATIDRYIQTVSAHPEVRLAEFEQLHAMAGLPGKGRLLEFLTEGRMLDRFYPDASIDRVDLVTPRLPEHAREVALTDWALAGVGDAQYDGLLSLVPVHHANDEQKQAYLQNAWRVLKHGGVLAFGEVEPESEVHRFLDGFVNRFTPNGHAGDYPGADFARQIQAAGFVDVVSEVRACPWVFQSAQQVCDYLVSLFGLDHGDPEQMLYDLADCPGLEQRSETWILHWSLRYYRGVKPLVETKGLLA